ncbi:glycosyl hydrolase family 28-related protein [Pseudoalteromonas denitrificans]|uniref:Pectate lyase superfamily protein n=1 Tax=Pseudoalteromonas denitrificans DSM 6059 TaxID=1123010 RepID=A0A1I1U2N2_9GAMM|nr:glycosyl hydrolase family 28-related protein [Pseudoalteromonas denitrificans]SFD65072.1 Pectate lyase superfamily protein [Pseudoalteromonas denitrificans DSM 6059]
MKIKLLSLVLLSFISFISYASPPSSTSITGPSYHISRGTFSYSWAKPSGTITKYEVEKSIDGQKSIVSFDQNTTSYSETFNDLITYTARVRACNTDGCSSWSGYEVNIVKPYWPPNASSISSPSTSATGQFSVTWSTPWGYGINRYELERSIGNANNWQQVQSANSLNFNEQVNANGTYYYRVTVCNIDNRCSGLSNTASVTVDIPTPPSATTIIGPDYHITRGTYSYSWARPSGTITRYEVEKSIDGQTSIVNFDQNTTSYSETFSNLITYTSRVRACNTAGCSGWSAYEVNIVKPYWPPNKTTITATQNNNASNEFNLTWPQPWGYEIKRYILEEQVDGQSSWSIILNKKTLSTKVIKSPGKYHYRVNVCNIDEKCSGYSNVVSINVVSPPINPNSKPNFSWNLYHPINTETDFCLPLTSDSHNVSYYQVYAGVSSGSLSKKHDVNKSVSCTPTTLNFSTKESFYIAYKACNSAGCSGLSPTEKIVVFGAPSSPSVTLSGKNVSTDSVTATITAGISTIWTGAYVKITHIKPSGVVSIQTEKPAFNGTSQPLSWTSPALRESGTHKFEFITCNKTDAHCSQATSKAIVIEALIAPEKPLASLINNDINLDWNEVSGTSYYEVSQQFNGSSWSPVATIHIIDGDNSKAIRSNLPPGTYAYKVKACNSNNTCSDDSPVSNSITIKSLCENIGNDAVVSISKCGASKNDESDDTLAIQAAIYFANSNNKDVYIPGGTYKISQTLTVPDGVTISGTKRELSILSTASNITLMKIFDNVTLSNLYFKQSNFKRATKVPELPNRDWLGTAIEFNDSAKKITFDLIYVFGFVNGIIGDNLEADTFVFDDVIVDRVINGIKLTGYTPISSLECDLNDSTCEFPITFNNLLIQHGITGLDVTGIKTQVNNSVIQDYTTGIIFNGGTTEQQGVFEINNFYAEGDKIPFKFENIKYINIDSFFTQGGGITERYDAVIDAKNVGLIEVRGSTAQGYWQNDVNLINTKVKGTVHAVELKSMLDKDSIYIPAPLQKNYTLNQDFEANHWKVIFGRSDVWHGAATVSFDKKESRSHSYLITLTYFKDGSSVTEEFIAAMFNLDYVYSIARSSSGPENIQLRIDNPTLNYAEFQIMPNFKIEKIEITVEQIN